MAANAVRFDSVAPRDVALVVLEELSVSPPFRSWLLDAIGLENVSATVLEARDSVADGDANGDGVGADGTDADANGADRRSALEVGFEVDGDRIRLVPIVALDADGAQDLESWSANPGDATGGPRDPTRTALVAPNDVCERVAVDSAVSLESVRDRLTARERDRGEYRAALLTAAIERGAHGPDEASDAVQRYRSLVTDREPAFDLEVDPSLEAVGDDGPSGADAAVSIDAPSLADDHLLVHAPASGTVELRIPGAADHLETFAARYASAIPPATDLLTAGDALVLRLSAPAIEPDSSADDEASDAAAVDEALSTVRDLLAVSERVGDRSA